MPLQLVKPNAELLGSYIDAIAEGPFTNMALDGFGDSSPETIRANPAAYLELVNNGSPRTVNLPNGDKYQLTQHEILWITDGTRYLGSLALRYAGDEPLFTSYAGHVGMAIRPSLLNRGHGVRAATEAWSLAKMFLEKHGLESIYATCSPKNSPSRRLIEHNGGVLVREIDDAFGTGPSLVFAIDLRKTTK